LFRVKPFEQMNKTLVLTSFTAFSVFKDKWYELINL